MQGVSKVEALRITGTVFQNAIALPPRRAACHSGINSHHSCTNLPRPRTERDPASVTAQGNRTVGAMVAMVMIRREIGRGGRPRPPSIDTGSAGGDAGRYERSE